MDTVYKLLLDDEGKKAKLSRKSVGALLTIYMHVTSNMRISLSDF